MNDVPSSITATNDQSHIHHSTANKSHQLTASVSVPSPHHHTTSRQPSRRPRRAGLPAPDSFLPPPAPSLSDSPLGCKSLRGNWKTALQLLPCSARCWHTGTATDAVPRPTLPTCPCCSLADEDDTAYGAGRFCVRVRACVCLTPVALHSLCLARTLRGTGAWVPALVQIFPPFPCGIPLHAAPRVPGKLVRLSRVAIAIASPILCPAP